MNKILVDGDKLYLNESTHFLEVSGNATIYINDMVDVNLNIQVNDDSSLEIYDFTTKSLNKIINITQENNSKVSYVHTFKVEGEYKLEYHCHLNGNNNTNNVFISGVSLGTVALDIDGDVKEKTSDNELNENIKVLTHKGTCYTSPMLHINAKDVIANHNTAISNIRDEDLFYLTCKGIDEVNAISLIIDGYIYGYIKKYSSEFYDLIKEKGGA